MRLVRRRRTARGMLVAALVCVLALTPGLAEARPADDPFRQFVDCGPASGASWRLGTETGTRWRVLATPQVRCAQAMTLFAGVTSRVASRGAVDIVTYAGAPGWSCTAGRSFGYGLCTLHTSVLDHYVLIGAEARATEPLLRDVRAGTGIVSVLRWFTGSRPMWTPPTDSDAPPAQPPTACTPTTGALWSRTAPAGGNQWFTYTGGGMTCVAAQGWVADVSARIMRRTSGIVEFDGGDGWRCLLGSAELRIGACARRSPQRTDLEPAWVVVLGGQTLDVRTPILGLGYDSALWHLAQRASASYRAARLCAALAPGVTWNVDGVTGDSWLVGTIGGYPCEVAKGVAERLARQTRGDMTRGVGIRTSWACTSTRATASITCTWKGVLPRIGAPPMLRVVVMANRPGALATLVPALTR